MKPTKATLEQYFSIIENYGGSRGNWKFYFKYLFDGVDFERQTMLDIGGGMGRASYYAACRGADRVVCLEPESAGSRSGTMATARDIGSALQLGETVVFEPITFQAFEPNGRPFDIILLHNSVNHLDEAACRTLHHNGESRAVFSAMFAKLARLTRAGGTLILADCTRHNFFAAVGLRNPFARTIAWDIHQSPQLWARILSEAGFVKPRIRWTTHNRLRSVGRVLFGNRIASYFGRSHFCLTMQKSGESSTAT